MRIRFAPISRGVLIAVLSMGLLAVAACSTVRFAYNNIDAVIRFMASDYVEFDTAQYEQFKTRLDALHQWHRTRELPAYVALLQTAGGKVAKGVAADDVAWAIGALRSRYRLLAARAAEDAAPLLAQLSDAQIVELEKNFAEKNRKFSKERLEGDQKKLRQKRADQLLDYFREMTGKLSDAQEARIERFADDYGRMTALRFEDRKRWQGQALLLLRTERKSPQFAAHLTALFTNPEEGRSAEYIAASARYESGLADLVVDIDRTLTAEQRVRAVRRMQHYTDEFTALSGARPARSST